MADTEAEQVAAYVDEQLAEMADPEGYALTKQREGINAEYDRFAEVADDETVTKLAMIRDAKLAALEPRQPPEPEPVQTVDNLSVPETASKKVALWTAAQFVEPERDGKPWCSWEDAEAMLVLAAHSVMRGAAGIKAEGHRLTRDEKEMTLTLELV